MEAGRERGVNSLNILAIHHFNFQYSEIKEGEKNKDKKKKEKKKKGERDGRKRRLRKGKNT